MSDDTNHDLNRPVPGYLVGLGLVFTLLGVQCLVIVLIGLAVLVAEPIGPGPHQPSEDTSHWRTPVGEHESDSPARPASGVVERSRPREKLSKR